MLATWIEEGWGSLTDSTTKLYSMIQRESPQQEIILVRTEGRIRFTEPTSNTGSLPVVCHSDTCE